MGRFRSGLPAQRGRRARAGASTRAQSLSALGRAEAAAPAHPSIEAFGPSRTHVVSCPSRPRLTPVTGCEAPVTDSLWRPQWWPPIMTSASRSLRRDSAGRRVSGDRGSQRAGDRVVAPRAHSKVAAGRLRSSRPSRSRSCPGPAPAGTAGASPAASHGPGSACPCPRTSCPGARTS